MKKPTLRLFAILSLLLLVFSLVACSSSSRSEVYWDSEPPHGSSSNDNSTNWKDEDNTDQISSGSSSDITLPQNRVIIKNVTETVETLEYDTFLEALSAAVHTANGYFSSSTYHDNSYHDTAVLRTANFSIRIPADKLTDFCNEVEGIGHVTAFYEKVDDITLAYVTIESRIEVLEKEEAAMLSMLEKAESISDMLAIRSYLENTQSELASLRAQKRVYDDQVAYSTVTMTVREVKRMTAQNNMSTGEEIGHTFMNSLYGIGEFFRALAIFLIGYSPVLLLLAVILTGIILLLRYLVRRERTQRNNQNKKQ